ncbi:MAG: M67 family metallopeptidase [Longimicrobiaceae bacterium]
MPPSPLRSSPEAAPAAEAGLRVPAAALAAVRAHAAAAYPEECCGFLLGREPGGARAVARAVPAENRWEGGRGARFLIPADAVRRVEAEAAGEGLALVGFYHSHPDGRPEPSGLDREHAWPWYSYLIVAAARGGAGEARSWRLRDDRSGFRAEDVLFTGEEP